MAARLHIPRSSLQLGRSIAQGGEGKVYELSTSAVQKIGHRGKMLAKIYGKGSTEKPLSGAEAQSVLRQVEWLYGLSASERTGILSRAAWPVGVIGSRGRPVEGVVMADKRVDFTVQIKTDETTRKPNLAAVSYMLQDDAWLKKYVGSKIGGRERLECAIAIVDCFSYLHEREIVVGDVSAKNILVLPSPPFRCSFIDCDAMFLAGQGKGSGQGGTAGWTLPGNELANTKAGDVYKFGLLVGRLLTRQRRAGARVLAQSKELPAEVRPLVSRSFGARSARPTIGEWKAGLVAVREAERKRAEAKEKAERKARERVEAERRRKAKEAERRREAEAKRAQRTERARARRQALRRWTGRLAKGSVLVALGLGALLYFTRPDPLERLARADVTASTTSATPANRLYADVSAFDCTFPKDGTASGGVSFGGAELEALIKCSSNAEALYYLRSSSTADLREQLKDMADLVEADRRTGTWSKKGSNKTQGRFVSGATTFDDRQVWLEAWSQPSSRILSVTYDSSRQVARRAYVTGGP